MTLKGLKINFNEAKDDKKMYNCNFNLELDEVEVEADESIEELRLIGELLMRYDERKAKEMEELRSRLHEADETIKRLQR